MYTVKELIEALSKCPEDYEVMLVDGNGDMLYLDMVGINHEMKTVDLFDEG